MSKNLGLVSISYRNLSSEAVVRLCEKFTLMEIEWGGDIHVPHGNIKEAARVARLCKDSGIKIVSYGSYCDPGTFSTIGTEFQAVVDTSLALGAPIIRCWCGEQASKRGDKITLQLYDEMVAKSIRMSETCERFGIKLSYEYVFDFINELFQTERNRAAQKFLEDAAHVNTYSHWQQRGIGSDNIEGLKYLIANDILTIVHANFHESDSSIQPKESINKRKKDWSYYRELLQTYDKPYSILIETCSDNNPDHLSIYIDGLRQYLLNT